MSLLSQWNTIKDNLLAATNKSGSVQGGADTTNINNNITTNTNVDTNSEEYLKSLFQYANRWNCTKRSWVGSRVSPTREHIGHTTVSASTRKYHDTSQDWAWGDNYIGVRECYVYCDEAHTLSTSFFTDDEGSIWLNGSQKATSGSCKTVSVSLPFKKGLNHVEIAFSEQSGGDAGYITTDLANQSWVKWMYARYKL